MYIQEFVQDMLEYCITLGTYASEVQCRAPAYLSKKGSHVFSRSLTTSDLAIERFIEVVLLAKYPEVRFKGEEVEKSLNNSFFTHNGEYLVTIDPINHTSYYQAGETKYEIIITLSKGEQIVAAICYQPAFTSGYCAFDGKAFLVSADSIKQKQWHTAAFAIPSAKVDDVLTINDPDLCSKLGSSCAALDAISSYQDFSRSIGMSDIFTGDIVGFVKRHGHLRDWIAIAYITDCAGGFVSDFSGNQLDWKFNHEYCFEEMVVTNSESKHKQIVEALG